MTLRSPLCVAALAGVAAMTLSTGCKSNNDANQQVQQNPVVPVAQPLLLQGTVVDSVSRAAVVGANVTVLRTDGSTLSTLTTDAQGGYSLDVSSQTADTLNVRATAAGYGVATAAATMNRVSNSGAVPTLALFRYQGASQSFGPAGGTVTATGTGESASTTPLGFVLPAGALSGTTTLTVTPVPVSQVPAPTSATAQTLAVVSITPAGLSFAQPATATCPLPMKLTAGRELTAYRLNTITNAWEPLSAKATVDDTGLAAKLPISATGTYTFTEEITINPNATANAMDIATAIASEGEEASAAAPLLPPAQTVALTSGTTRVSLSYEVAVTLSATTGLVPTKAWITSLLEQRYGITGTYTVTHYLAYPALPANYQSNGRQYNPDKPGETGQWEYRWYFEPYNMPERNLSLNALPFFSVKVKVAQQSWRLTSATGWYWKVISGGTGNGG